MKLGSDAAWHQLGLDFVIQQFYLSAQGCNGLRRVLLRSFFQIIVCFSHCEWPMKAFVVLFAFLLTLLPHSQSTLCGEKENLKLRVQGMHCSTCVSMIRRSVQRISGVTSVSIDIRQGTVEVVCDSTLVRVDDVQHAIRRLGYKLATADSAGHAEVRK